MKQWRFLVLAALLLLVGLFASRAAKADTSGYTNLNSPIGSVFRMDQDGDLCYLLIASRGTDVSCPASHGVYEQDVSKITFSDLGFPDVTFYQMRDGDQTCFLTVGTYYGAGISCP